MHKLSIMGADISSLKKSEDLGGIHACKDGTQADAIKILKDHDMNYARIRIWLKSPDGYHGETQLLEMAKRLNTHDINLLVDFHYSDTWADPSKQPTPKAWEGLDFDGLKKALYNHTFDGYINLIEQGTPPDMVQVGNEVTNGMVWPDGKNDVRFDNLAELLKEGYRAVKDCSPATLVMLHLDNGGNNEMYRCWFDNILKREVPFDLIGASYYPYWHGTLVDLRNNLNDLAIRYKKDIVVVETACPYKSEDKDNFPNVIQDQMTSGCPFKPEGQKNMLQAILDIFQAVPNNHGLGIMWRDATSKATAGTLQIHPRAKAGRTRHCSILITAPCPR